MINVCIFSHDQVTYAISAMDYSSFNRQSAIWADTDIRLIVKITAQSVRNLYYYISPIGYRHLLEFARFCFHSEKLDIDYNCAQYK